MSALTEDQRAEIIELVRAEITEQAARQGRDAQELMAPVLESLGRRIS